MAKYCLDDSKTEHEVYSKEDIDKLLSDNLNFKVLTGSVTIPANSNKVIDIVYPEGFNKDNCVVVSTMTTSGYLSNNKYIYPANTALAEAVPTVTLGDEDISLNLVNGSSSNSITLNYKITIMKYN